MRIILVKILLSQFVLLLSVAPPRTDVVFELENLIGGEIWSIPMALSPESPRLDSGFVEVGFYPELFPFRTIAASTVYLIDKDDQRIPFTIAPSRFYGPINRISYGRIDLSSQNSALLSNNYSGFFISQPARIPFQPERPIRFILEPTNVATRYCQDGIMGFAPSVDRFSLQFRARISLVNADEENYNMFETINRSGEPVDLKVDSSNSLTLPQEIRNRIEQEIVIQTGLTWATFQRHPQCERMLDRLPSIRYTVVDANDSAVVDVFVSPYDYVSLDNQDERRCQIDIVGIVGTGVHLTGRSLLRSAGVFVDYTQRRIGFCDPL